MIYFKECPKCHGDLLAGKDADGQYLSCIQCGYLRDLLVEVAQAPVRETFVIDAPKTVRKPRKKVRVAA